MPARSFLGRGVAAAGATWMLAACSLAPHYSPPQITTPTAYKEMGPWTPAVPADDAPRGDWWTVYGDTTLNTLETRLVAGNPDLAAAVARYDQARALEAQAAAASYPQVGLQGQATDNRQSQDRPLRVGGPNQYADNQVGAGVSYELDLWGRVRNLVAAGKARAQASQADIASVRLSLQAQLADDYLNLRGLDAQGALLARTVAAYSRALGLTQDRYSGGAVSKYDVDQARTQLETARAQQSDVQAQRALLEHAVAALVGVPASSFSLPVLDALPAPVRVPVNAASVLLQRRPDIAAAERQVAAANAEIGVARAAFYPSISLDASGGFENAGGVNLLSASNSFWSLGPALALTVFDGGRRRAKEREARALMDQAADAYKSTVLAAFQQVEDNLALCNVLAVESEREDAAVAAASQAEDLALFRYQQGATTYLDVVTAQTETLTAQRAELELQARRLQASVDLVRALGGGWRVAGA
jgi:NodT family efflux transporter outer membrane factor (OMF) lipoprotein